VLTARKTCTNLAPIGQETAKNDNKSQQAQIPEMCKNPHKSTFFDFCFGAFKAKIRVRFPLAVPTSMKLGWRFCLASSVVASTS